MIVYDFQSKALLVMLSLGQFSKVLEMLYGMRQFNRAACFTAALEEFGLLDQSPDNGGYQSPDNINYRYYVSKL